MHTDLQKTPVGFLGAGPHELELLLELHAGGGVEIVGVYDVDPRSPGLATAELIGVPTGSDTAALERLRGAAFVVLPQDRRSQPEAVRWAAGLRAELVSLPDARRRWSKERAALPAVPGTDPEVAEHVLREAVDTSARLQDRSQLAEWLLGIAMRTVGANGGSIQLLVPETSELHLAAARGLSEKLVRLGRQRLGEGIAGTVAAIRSPRVTHGVQRDGPRERGLVEASISLPLEDELGLTGVLNVSSTHPGKRFGGDHVRSLERLAPRLARLLRDAGQVGAGFPQFDLPRLLRRLDTENADLPARLAALSEHARVVLGADAASLWLTSEDGEWMRAAATVHPDGTTPDAPRHADLDSVLLELRWTHVSEVVADDSVGTAIDNALAHSETRRSRLLAPLEGIDRVGVLGLDFAALSAAENCQHKAVGAIGQLGFCIETLLRDARAAQRVQSHASVAHALQRLVATPDAQALDTALATEAARLVGGASASVRRVDEERRTYSRPTTWGIETENLPMWRPLDARITERTLAARRAVLTTAGEETDETSSRCSLLSVPIQVGERILAVINVYEKRPQSLLETHAFTIDDRTVLETLAFAASHLWSRGGPAPTRTLRVVPRRDLTGAGLEELLAHELELAAAADRSLGVWVLRFDGLAALGDGSAEARARIAASVRLGLRWVDVVRWTSDESMTILGHDVGRGAARLEERLGALVQPHLARAAGTSGTGIALHIGTSIFPDDGNDAHELLDTAAARAQ